MFWEWKVVKRWVYLFVSILIFFSISVPDCSAGELKGNRVPQISDKKLLEMISGSSLKMPERLFIPGIKEILGRMKIGDREERYLYMLFMFPRDWSYRESPDNAKKWFGITPEEWKELISPIAPITLTGPLPGKCPLCGKLFGKSKLDFLNSPFQVKTTCCGGIIYGKREDMPEDYPARPNHVEKISHLDGTIVDYHVYVPKGSEHNKSNWFSPEGELWHSRIWWLLNRIMPDLVSGVFWVDNKKAAVQLAVILDRLAEVYPGIPINYGCGGFQSIVLGRDGERCMTKDEYLSLKRPFKYGYTDKPFYHRLRGNFTKLSLSQGWNHDQIVQQLSFFAIAFDLIRYREEVKEYSMKKYGDRDAWDKKVMKGLIYEAWLEATGSGGGTGNTMTQWIYGAFKLGILMKDKDLYSRTLGKIENFIINGYFSDGLCEEGAFSYAGMMRNTMKSLWLLSKYGGVDIKEKYPIVEEIEKGDYRIVTLHGVESMHGDQASSLFRRRWGDNPITNKYEDVERSQNFPEYGLVCLRGGVPGHRLETIGAYQVAIGHTHWDRLSLQVFFEGLNLFPDVGYGCGVANITKSPWKDFDYGFELLPNPNPSDSWGGWKYGHNDGSSTHLLVQIDGWADKEGPCTFHRFLGGQTLDHPAYSVQLWEADACKVFDKGAPIIHPYKSSYMGRPIKPFPYPVSLYRRQVITVTPLDGRAFLIDIFRIKGGKRHDMYWHVPADSPETSLGTPRPIAKKNLREYFTGRFNPQIKVKDSMADIVSMEKWVNPKGVWKASWLVEPGRYHPASKEDQEKFYAKWLKVLKGTRITMWGISFGGKPEKEEIITAKGPWATRMNERINGKRYSGVVALKDAFSYLIESRIGKKPGLESTYVHVIEPHGAVEEGAIKDVEVYEGRRRDSANALGIKVRCGDGSTIYVASTTNGESSFKKRRIELKGRLGLISETKEGEAGIIALYDGTYIKSPNVSLSIDKSWNAKLVGIVGDLTGIPQEQALIVETDRPIPLGKTLEGQMLTVYHQISNYHTTGYTIASVEQHGTGLFRINLAYHPTFIQHVMKVQKIDKNNPRLMCSDDWFFKGQGRGAYIGRRIRFPRTGFECAMAGVPRSNFHCRNSDRILLEKEPPSGKIKVGDPFIVYTIQPGDRVIIPSLFEARSEGNKLKIASNGRAILKIKTESKSAVKVVGSEREPIRTSRIRGGFLEIRIEEEDLKDGLVTIELE
ncbi:hypothetical protein ES707_19144 [subsurface metagenome]